MRSAGATRIPPFLFLLPRLIYGRGRRLPFLPIRPGNSTCRIAPGGGREQATQKCPFDEKQRAACSVLHTSVVATPLHPRFSPLPPILQRKPVGRTPVARVVVAHLHHLCSSCYGRGIHFYGHGVHGFHYCAASGLSSRSFYFEHFVVELRSSKEGSLISSTSALLSSRQPSRCRPALRRCTGVTH